MRDHDLTTVEAIVGTANEESAGKGAGVSFSAPEGTIGGFHAVCMHPTDDAEDVLMRIPARVVAALIASGHFTAWARSTRMAVADAREAGRRQGRAALQHELRTLIGAE